MIRKKIDKQSASQIILGSFVSPKLFKKMFKQKPKEEIEENPIIKESNSNNLINDVLQRNISKVENVSSSKDESQENQSNLESPTNLFKKKLSESKGNKNLNKLSYDFSIIIYKIQFYNIDKYLILVLKIQLRKLFG